MDILVIGGGGHAKSIISVIKKVTSLNLIGYTDLVSRGEILGIPYLGNDEVIKQKGISNVVIGISYPKTAIDLSLRVKLIKEYAALGLKFPSIISPSAIVNSGVEIQQGTVVMDGVIINSGTKIGNFCVLNTRALIDHDCVVGSYTFISPGATLCGEVEVGDYSFVGAGSVIKDGVRIKNNIVVGTGSNVVGDLLVSGVYFGNPAQLTKTDL